MYSFLQDSGENDMSFVELWIIKISLKVEIFVWLVLKRRVLTADKLLKRGWSKSGNYALCSSRVKTADHLFATCEIASLLLEGLLPNKREVRNCRVVDKLWEASKCKQGALGRKELATIAAS